MTENGDPKENAQAERVNNTVKNELLKGMRFTSIGQVTSALRKAIDFYNNERPHMSIDMMTPSEASSCKGEMKKLWTSYREEAIRRNQSASCSCEIPEESLPSSLVQGSPSGLRPPVNP